VLPQLVLVEAGYFVRKLLGPAAEADFLRELVSGSLDLQPLERDDLIRMAELIETYADLGLGTVDASVIATADRLGVSKIATLDRRHFTVVRPRHVSAFELVP
jgi:predicted nucleic acid-binding protein